MSDKQQSERRATQLAAFDRLLTIMDELREKCPWDRKQTLESLRHLTIEETYELSDAIIEGDLEEVKMELGDLMLHNVFYAKIGSEKEAFDIADVLNAVCEKLIVRHPHIYGSVEANDEETVKANWEKIKLTEHGDQPRSVLAGVPKSLPSLVKAMRIQEKARGVGFDWDETSQVVEKVREELDEFLDEYQSGDPDGKMSSEFGDLLFSLINLARFLDLNPEEALERTNKKFIKRFQYLENASRADGKDLTNMSLTEMEYYWQKAKTL